MKHNEILRMKGFYENELIHNILSFWLPRCEDKVYGGYFNCFDNEGNKLISHDKYTWSQGRFVWIFSRLSSIKADIFSKKEKTEFLKLAKSGRDFLMTHCLMNADDIRCVYLMEEDGSPKHVGNYAQLDMSIYADCFVVLAMTGYAIAADDYESYKFGKKLYVSIIDRVSRNNFNTLPYPLSEKYRAHGIPMILSNVTKEMYETAIKFDLGYCDELKRNLEGFVNDTMYNFTDENHVIHEVISYDNKPVSGLLGQHANPGHTIEDMWFMAEASELLNRPEMLPYIAATTKQALNIGWDKEYGGILHYSSVNGGRPEITGETTDSEPTVKQVTDGWSDKLWWIHAEALYTTLLCYSFTNDDEFLMWNDKVFEYTFNMFPNKNQEVREWKQILKRDGSPQDKVVALPVKDPYHITRDLILIIELLDKMGNQK